MFNETASDPDAIVSALELTDMTRSQGRNYFTYGNHNLEPREETPAFMWRQWPEPVVTVMQYFEKGQNGLDAAVVFPEIYQTHGTILYRAGHITLSLSGEVKRQRRQQSAA